MTQPERETPQADLSLIAATILMIGCMFLGFAAVIWMIGRPGVSAEFPLGFGAFFTFVGAGAFGLAQPRAGRSR